MRCPVEETPLLNGPKESLNVRQTRDIGKVQTEMSADGFKWADLQPFSILSAAESIGIKH